MSLNKRLILLDELVQKGNFIAAVEQFFDDNAQTKGQGDIFITYNKAEKLATLNDFLTNIAQINLIKLYYHQSFGNISDSFFTFDFTNQQGERLVWHENIRRQWSKAGFILSEYYISVENIAAIQPPNKTEIKTEKKIVQDNLKKVEGIGAKIEKLFHEAGIHTFEALSQTPIEKMQLILKAAGSRYRLHDPSTWAAQAALAHHQEWEKLAEWQAKLIGGKIFKSK